MNKTITTVQSGDRKITLEIPSDSDIREMKDVFKVILTFLTFDEETIKDLFPDEEF